LDDVRQRVLANMCFNMGIGKLLGFKNFLVAVQAKDWTKAVAEMKNSAWFKQVGQRAVRLASMMESGNDPGTR
jgi:lysozyme